MAYGDLSAAMTKRSLRTVRAELEFLLDSSVLTSAQYSAIISQLPADTASTNGVANGIPNNNTTTANGYPNEKSDYYASPPPSAPVPAVAAQPPPPSYNPSTPAIPSTPLTYATALYAYAATDAGDLPLSANDRVAVTEYMNADWWKGRNERTGQEGIFPRSYVRVEEAGNKVANSSGYGNMPLEVANAPTGGNPAVPQGPNKVQEGGKKFGKKLGNAAIFGAGATIGGNIVNSIF